MESEEDKIDEMKEQSVFFCPNRAILHQRTLVLLDNIKEKRDILIEKGREVYRNVRYSRAAGIVDRWLTTAKESVVTIHTQRILRYIRQRSKFYHTHIGTGLFLILVLYLILDPFTDPAMHRQKKNGDKGYLREEDLWNDPRLINHLQVANASESDYWLLNRKPQWEIGEEIQVTIQLRDGYGNPKKTGGDHLRIRLHEPKLGASSAGYIIDHENGTYTGVVTALWSGRPVITVALFYTREAIKVVYELRRRLSATRIVMALFQHGDNQEVTPCHPFPFVTNGSNKMCDLSSFNTGMSWFCGKPNNKQIFCNDWTAIKSFTPDLPLNENEAFLLKHENVGVYISTPVSVDVVARNPKEKILKASTKCYNFDRKRLWFQKAPVGFFYQNEWHIRHCRGSRKQTDLQQCLQGSQVYLLGDSTMKGFYKAMVEILNCDHANPGWMSDAWYKPQTCLNSQHNFRFHWHTHSLPITINTEWENMKYATRSIASELDQIPVDAKALVVLHLYAHMMVFSQDVFINRVRRVRDSVKRLLFRNKDAIVIIKGPHTFRVTPIGGPERQCDYLAYLYKDILVREFSHLKDKVIFIDQIDFTVARDLQDIHPKSSLVTEIMYNALAYACDFKK